MIGSMHYERANRGGAEHCRRLRGRANRGDAEARRNAEDCTEWLDSQAYARDWYIDVTVEADARN